MSKFFDYFQITCLIILVCVILAKTIHFRLKKINPLSIGKGGDGLYKIMGLFVFFAVVAFWIIEVVRYSLRVESHLLPSFFHTELFNSLPAKIIGSVLLSLGALMIVLAQISFGDSWRIGIDREKPDKLITKGIFAFSRNPIFFAFNLYFTGTLFINGTVIFLILSVFVVLNLHYHILCEERFLMETYGQEYEDYCSTVGRYFTWRHRKHTPNPSQEGSLG